MVDGVGQALLSRRRRASWQRAGVGAGHHRNLSEGRIFKVLTSRGRGWKGDAGARAESGIWTPLSLKRLLPLPLSPPNKPQLLSHLSGLT